MNGNKKNVAGWTMVVIGIAMMLTGAILTSEFGVNYVMFAILIVGGCIVGIIGALTK